MAPAIWSGMSESPAERRGTGSFILEHHGTFDNTSVTARVVILPDTGTGELRGLRGDGSLALGGHAEQYPLSLNYNFSD